MSDEFRNLATGIHSCYNGDLQEPAPYYARVIEKLDNGTGYWNSLRVGIFERVDAPGLPGDIGEKKIGEYIRNYSSLYRTFHPFFLRGEWYALYSKHYTATRIMHLPTCNDIGGEEPAGHGFCPTDFWVPGLDYIETLHDPGCPRSGDKPDYTQACKCGDDVRHTATCEWMVSRGTARCNCDRNERYWNKYHVWHFPDRIHGFVAGCHWGDDSSWKIQYLDLSKADKGIIKRDDRFGYIELPENLTLDKAIELSLDDSEEPHSVRIAIQRHYHINGKPWDDD